MYNIVGDIDNYKLFLPWVMKSRVLTTTPEELTAELEVGFASVRER